MRPVLWIAIESGRLALWPRPGHRYLRHLKDAGVTRLVTLLSAREGAEIIGNEVEKYGVAWTWLPLANAQPPAGKARATLVEGIIGLSSRVDDGESLLIHCAAGIHRTGMVAYTLLRLRGFSSAESLRLIGKMRSHTLEGIRQDHIDWGDEVATDY